MVTKSNKIERSAITRRVVNRSKIPAQSAGSIEKKVLGLSEDIHVRGNFTAVILFDDTGVVKGLGITKRNPTDPEDGNVGYNIALTRATEDAAEHFIKKNKTREKAKAA